MKTINSVHNEQIKHLAKLLSQAKARREAKQTVLEGVHLLQTYLDAGGDMVQVYIPESKRENSEVSALQARLGEQKTTWVGEAALSKITSLTEACDVMTLIDLPSENALPQTGDCIVLERVQDPGNVGTILRSAAAAGIKNIVLSKGSADVWSPKVLRASMGAVFLVQIYTGAEMGEWLADYRGEVRATALNARNTRGLYDLNLRNEGAWIFGNEGSGVSAEVLARVDAGVKIPMAGATESLNVAMAATVCLFEQMRQRLNGN